jgi:hypothetical protein
MQTTDYFSAIRQQRAALTPQFPDGACLVISIRLAGRPSPAGSICEVNIDNAARLITEGTHRLASKEEIQSFREEQEFKRSPSADPLEAARKRFGLLTGKKGDA